MTITETTTATMKAARLAGPGELRFETVPLPEPGPGQTTHLLSNPLPGPLAA